MTDTKLGKLQILGIDAAVDPRNTGLAMAGLAADGWTLHAVTTGSRDRDMAEQTISLLNPACPVLVAIDAPLGWPAAFAKSLQGHRAGDALSASKEALFSRETDRLVRARTGLMPLSVSADRIARTAAAALELITGLRERLDNSLPLLLDPSEAQNGGLIEVYPAATLKQRGLPCRGYKRPDHGPVRRKILNGISSEINLAGFESVCIDSDHCLDAVLCVLTAIDFVERRCAGPDSTDLALQEGWIWFRKT